MSLDPKSALTTERTLRVDGTNFTQYWKNGDSTYGVIKWVYNCIFKFESLNKSSIDSSDLENSLINSFGDPCFEITGKKGDTLLFRTTYTGNLHITSSKGTIIKIL